MKVQVHATLPSHLPEGDVHPYRTGAWRPQTTEYDAWDLDVVGEIPRDLAGVYVRNTENPLFDGITRYHPFDGDGMLHAIVFRDGEATYRNRFVRTEGLRAELEAGRPLWAGITEPPALSVRREGWGARGLMKDASSTDVVVHHGVVLSSFYQCGDLYRLDPLTLADRGRESWGGRFPKEGVSAHTKVDENSGELFFFNYSTSAPYMHYGVLSPAGELAHYVDVPLPGPRLPHDMAFTERFVILNDCPLFWDPALLAQGAYVSRWHPELPTRFAILPRRGATSEIRWFEAAPTYVLHWINAYEEGDTVVLDGFFERDPVPKPEPGADPWRRMFRTLDLHTMGARAHRWRFDLRTGAVKEEDLSDRVMEFGMINGRFGGRRYRYSYNALPVAGAFLFEGIVKHDLETGREEPYAFGEGVYGSETVMAPREGSRAEDDGYLVTFVTDLPRDRSECWVFDAARPAAGPLARIRLPERISSGTHATWAPASAIPGW
jgi:carotenoid cleavage dioxygenase